MSSKPPHLLPSWPWSPCVPRGSPSPLLSAGAVALPNPTWPTPAVPTPACPSLNSLSFPTGVRDLCCPSASGGTKPPSPAPTTRFPPPGALPTTCGYVSGSFPNGLRSRQTCHSLRCTFNQRSTRDTRRIHVNQTDVLYTSSNLSGDLSGLVTVAMTDHRRCGS